MLSDVPKMMPGPEQWFLHSSGGSGNLQPAAIQTPHDKASKRLYTVERVSYCKRQAHMPTAFDVNGIYSSPLLRSSGMLLAYKAASRQQQGPGSIPELITEIASC